MFKLKILNKEIMTEKFSIIITFTKSTSAVAAEIWNTS